MYPAEMAPLAANLSVNFVQLVIDIAAILIGFFAIYLLVKVNRKLGGKINTALQFFVWGVLSNIAAILWSLFFEHTYVVAGMAFDIHQLLMTLGMIFFILSTHRFSSLIQNS